MLPSNLYFKAAVITLALAIVVALSACSERKQDLCFSEPLRGGMVCAKVPSGTLCSYNPLTRQMSCLDDSGEYFFPETRLITPR